MSHLKTIAGYTGIMVSLSILLKPIGIIKDMLVASMFGVSAEVGIFFLLVGIATFFASLMYAMHRGSITPAYIKIKQSGDISLAYSLATLSGFLYIFVIAGLCCTLYFFITPLISFFAPGYTAEKVQAVSRFAVPLVILLGSMAVNDFFTSVLEAEKRFISTRLAQACVSITLITVIILYHQNGWIILLRGLALGYLIAGSIQALLYIYIIRSSSLQFVMAINKLKVILPMWLPMAVGALVSNSSSIIDRMMITMLGNHSLAIYGYADTLVSNINSILILSINTAVLPVFSTISGDNKEELGEVMYKTYRYVLSILMPIVVIVVIYGDILVAVLYERGSFTNTDTNDVNKVLMFLIISIIPLVGIILLARVYNVLCDARTPLVVAIIAAILNISFNYILMQSYDLAGIALSTVLVYITILLLFILILSIKHKICCDKYDLISIIAIIFSGILVCYSSVFARRYGIIISVIIFFAVYLSCILIFRLREYHSLFIFLSNKIGVRVLYQK